MEYKGYNIKGDGVYGQKVIHSIGSGALPKSLRGSFTNERQAERAINSYINLLEQISGLEKTMAEYKSTEEDALAASFNMPPKAAPLGV